MYRRIRVHLPGRSTFIVGSDCGDVIEVSDPEFRSYLDKPETLLADHLRHRGATFQDLADDTIVRLRRGYRSRVDRVKFQPKGRPAEAADGPGPVRRPRRPHAPKPAAEYVESAVVASLLRFNQQSPMTTVEIPDDIPF